MTENVSAGRENQRDRRRRHRHRRKPRAVEQRAAQRDAVRAEAVGEHAGERRRHPEHEVLHGDRQRERLAAPVQVGAHRLQEQPEAVADPHRQREDHPGRHEDDSG